MRPGPVQVEQGYQLLKPYLNVTPIMTSQTINKMVGNGNQIFFKMDNMQKSGSFKARGASYAALQLDRSKDPNIVTHSSGNHGIALSFISNILGLKAYIVVPNNAPKIKIDTIRRYGGEVHISGPTVKEREALQAELIEKHNAIEIHPYDNWDVITGASTAGYEVIQQVSDLDYFYAPVGGGGCASGQILAFRYFSPKTKVVGVEPKNAADAHLSLKLGSPQPQFLPINTIADGLRTQLSQRTFSVISEGIHEIELVEEHEIIETTLLMWNVLKVVVETSCAAVFAAVLKNRHKYKNQKIGVLITGGNVDYKPLIPYLS